MRAYPSNPNTLLGVLGGSRCRSIDRTRQRQRQTSRTGHGSYSCSPPRLSSLGVGTPYASCRGARACSARTGLGQVRGGGGRVDTRRKPCARRGGSFNNRRKRIGSRRGPAGRRREDVNRWPRAYAPSLADPGGRAFPGEGTAAAINSQPSRRCIASAISSIKRGRECDLPGN